MQRALQQALRGQASAWPQAGGGSSPGRIAAPPGRGFRSGGRREPGIVSSTELLRTYRENVEKKRLLIREAEICRDRLVFVTQALRALLAEEGFLALLPAEGLDRLPRNLADRIGPVR